MHRHRWAGESVLANHMQARRRTAGGAETRANWCVAWLGAGTSWVQPTLPGPLGPANPPILLRRSYASVLFKTFALNQFRCVCIAHHQPCPPAILSQAPSCYPPHPTPPKKNSSTCRNHQLSPRPHALLCHALPCSAMLRCAVGQHCPSGNMYLTVDTGACASAPPVAPSPPPLPPSPPRPPVYSPPPLPPLPPIPTTGEAGLGASRLKK